MIPFFHSGAHPLPAPRLDGEDRDNVFLPYRDRIDLAFVPTSDGLCLHARLMLPVSEDGGHLHRFDEGGEILLPSMSVDGSRGLIPVLALLYAGYVFFIDCVPALLPAQQKRLVLDAIDALAGGGAGDGTGAGPWSLHLDLVDSCTGTTCRRSVITLEDEFRDILAREMKACAHRPGLRPDMIGEAVRTSYKTVVDVDSFLYAVQFTYTSGWDPA
jgi:hypothetical protein